MSGFWSLAPIGQRAVAQLAETPNVPQAVAHMRASPIVQRAVGRVQDAGNVHHRVGAGSVRACPEPAEGIPARPPAGRHRGEGPTRDRALQTIDARAPRTLNAEIAHIVARQQELRIAIDAIMGYLEGVAR